MLLEADPLRRTLINWYSRHTSLASSDGTICSTKATPLLSCTYLAARCMAGTAAAGLAPKCALAKMPEQKRRRQVCFQVDARTLHPQSLRASHGKCLAVEIARSAMAMEQVANGSAGEAIILVSICGGWHGGWHRIRECQVTS